MSGDDVESLLAKGDEVLRATGAVARMLARDGALWSDDDDIASLCTSRLGWLDLPASMPARVAELTAFADAVMADKIRDVVLCGMGGSSLAPEVYAGVFGSAEGRPRLTVLDSTDPRRIRAVEQGVDLAKTLVIVASKSGTTLETDALRRHFTARLADAGCPASKHLVAITDPGSALGTIARDEGWRAVFESPPDVGGRFSALAPFGLVPAALLGAPVEALLRSAAGEVAELHEHGADSRAAAIGALLGAATVEGRDKLVLHMSPGLRVFAAWAEQLIAESTGKQGSRGPIGVLPVIDDTRRGLAAEDRVVLRIEMAGEEAPALPPGTPALAVALAEKGDLGGLIVMLEAATALAAVILGVEPFDQPDVAAAKTATQSVLAGRAGPTVEPGAAGALAAAADGVEPDGYLAVLDWLPPQDGADAAVAALAARLRDHTGAAVTVGRGPRYLHSTGQLHKGGAATGVFVVLEGPDAAGTDEDLPVPGTDLTFGRLFAAQREGDIRALVSRGREVVRLRVVDVAGLDDLLS